MAPATPDKCRDKFSNRMVQLTRVITNWEKSGQGDGGHSNEDEDEEEKSEDVVFGSLRNRSAGALDQREQFVEYNQSYLLYLWHMLDKHGLFVSSLQMLNCDVAAGNGATGVPSVVLRRTDNDTPTAVRSFDDSASVSNNHKAEINRLSATIQNMADMDAREQQRNRDANRTESQLSFISNSLEILKSQKRELEENFFENRMKKNKAGVQFYKSQIRLVSQDINLKESQVNDLLGLVTSPHLSTPQRTNTTPVVARHPAAGDPSPESTEALPVAAVATAPRHSPRRGMAGLSSSESDDN
jgi:hypothetical protein